MKKLIILLAAALITGACSQNDTVKNDPRANEKIVTATIEELLNNPAEYEGMEVAVEGMVTHVCRHGGQKCFILASDGETQLRINTGGEIDEFDTSLEGSTVAFRGKFEVLDEQQSTALNEEYKSKEHHTVEMSHTQAEKSSYCVVASDFKEISR